MIGGTDATRLTKAQTIAGVLDELAADPATTIMVGDRHHDIDGAHTVDVAAIGALWGYGVEGELASAGADWLRPGRLDGAAQTYHDFYLAEGLHRRHRTPASSCS